MLERHLIFEEAKRQGFVRSGFNFVDDKNGIVINSAFLISCARRLAETMSLEEAIKRLIEEECKKRSHVI